jgi:anti-anti-sigma factor
VIDPMSEPLSTWVDAGPHFTARAQADGPNHVVALSGELDLSARVAAIAACASADHVDVHVDLSGLTFMDCAGYGALAVAASILDGRGGSMVLLNPVGATRRLLARIEEQESRLCAPVRYLAVPVPPVAAELPGAPCGSLRRGSGRTRRQSSPICGGPER